MSGFRQTFRLPGREGEFVVITETNSVREGQIQLGKAYFNMSGRDDSIYKAVRRSLSPERISCVDLNEERKYLLRRRTVQSPVGQTLELFPSETGGAS